jgi:crotonobetainyl-CoA:carnitine CoA-transferase CaiB-like acyl-CoA transferase
MAAMLLADLGADVLRIERPNVDNRLPRGQDVVLRNRGAIQLDLKSARDRALAIEAIRKADALIEGFRPGVAERLGIGPDRCFEVCPRLIYGRATGWGQDGPLAPAAGHDINYIAVAGALNSIGRAGQPPTPPLNIVGDYGGGALYLALGLVAALFEARRSGVGQVVDAAMVDGAASLMAKACGSFAAGQMTMERGTNVLDSGAPFYDAYECADGRWIAVGAIEPQFHAELLRRLEIDGKNYPAQWDRERWPEARRILAERFRRHTLAEWCARLEGTDACASPVLTLAEAALHPHLAKRGTFIDVGGVVQPAPAPRFSRTKCEAPFPPGAISTDAAQIVAAWGASSEVGRSAANRT